MPGNNNLKGGYENWKLDKIVVFTIQIYYEISAKTKDAEKQKPKPGLLYFNVLLYLNPFWKL